MQNYDVVIIGAGAAGLMCAIEAGKRQRKVIVLDHANKAGKKILMSGGGRCNFTNLMITPKHFISHNEHFCKSALSRYTQWDFIELVNQYKVPYHEKTLGQLFCDHKSKAILDMLLTECQKASVQIQLNTTITKIEKIHSKLFKLKISTDEISCQSLVIASGGLSIPTMGASGFGYQVAKQFNIPVWPTRAALVPFTLSAAELRKFSPLAGISLSTCTSNEHISFTENIIFTHRGLSGPAILQISSYWQTNENIQMNLLPQFEIVKYLQEKRQQDPKKALKSILSEYLPKRFLETVFPTDFLAKQLASLSKQDYQLLNEKIHTWHIMPFGTEGYRTAEVTLGGINCDFISSKTMEAQNEKGLYFIGEVLDVTGWLGGYNFQWAWSSGWAAGQVV
ncbi:MAG: NAD(P)/FAD-dependent oxidoreductase [Gammaproteobacteria bacterium]|nr:NAD(P)/FAD-dependent oxidoreductase [Gammaproteobacteria bacterium]